MVSILFRPVAVFLLCIAFQLSSIPQGWSLPVEQPQQQQDLTELSPEVVAPAYQIEALEEEFGSPAIIPLGGGLSLVTGGRLPGARALAPNVRSIFGIRDSGYRGWTRTPVPYSRKRAAAAAMGVDLADYILHFRGKGAGNGPDFESFREKMQKSG